MLPLISVSKIIGLTFEIEGFSITCRFWGLFDNIWQKNESNLFPMKFHRLMLAIKLTIVNVFRLYQFLP